MRTRRIHITGASGSGVTSLGRALADALAIPHHDTDDYFWLPTSPPYRVTRHPNDRLRLVREMFLDRDAWILSGSLDGWGRSLVYWFDLVAFVYAPTAIRLQRLREREVRRFGPEAIAPGGSQHDQSESFIEWASHYDDATAEGRNLPGHEAWLSTLSCPVVRLDGTRPAAELVNQVVALMDVSIRVAEPADLEAVGALLAASYATLLAPHYDSELLAGALPRLTKANPELLASGKYYVAECGRTLVGCGGWSIAHPASGEIVAGEAHVRHFATHPEWVRHGIGTALLMRCINDARSLGVNKLWSFSTLAAERFYQASGFTSIETINVPMGGLIFPGVLMSRDLV